MSISGRGVVSFSCPHAVGVLYVWLPCTDSVLPCCGNSLYVPIAAHVILQLRGDQSAVCLFCL